VSGFVWSQFRFRRGRVTVLGVAILVAAVSFVLLTSSAKTSSLKTHGTIGTSFRPAYDILVRPRGTKTRLEQDARLVRPNYLSGIFGGITLAQWEVIKSLRSVDVAAPVANLGYLLPFAYQQLPLNRFLDKGTRQIFRVQPRWRAYNGRSEYQDSFTGYVYVTRRPATYDRLQGLEENLGNGRVTHPCAGFGLFNLRGASAPRSPFSSKRALSCFSAASPDARAQIFPNDYQGRGIGQSVTVIFPILVTAIDPAEEAKLVDLPRTLVSGRYLRPRDDADYDEACLDCGPVLPALLSTRTYVDESLVVDIDRLRLQSTGASLAKALSHDSAPAFLTRQHGKLVARLTFSARSMYPRAVAQATRWQPHKGYRGLGASNYWTSGTVRYRVVERDKLRALPVHVPISVWRSSNHQGWYPAPAENRDVSFRQLHNHPDNQTQCGPTGVSFRAVGKFDPRRLRGFSRLSRVPLESYVPPEATAADAASRRALGGKPLTPTLNLADYISQPPFMLTNLRSALRLLGRWVPAPGCTSKNDRPFVFQRSSYQAPISAVRVRVKGVKGPDSLSLERIKVVAQKIHDKTGLTVDITAGSSPHPLLVEVPAGKFGRPDLLVREGWSKKGVSVTFLRALDRKDLLLFVLILLICGFFLSNGALAAVRARRAEIGTLRTLGWPGRAIFGAVLAELAGVGLIAGVSGAVLALGLVEIFDLHLDLWRVVLVIPLAVGLALVAGFVPALLAGRGQPLDALRPPIAGGGRLRRVSSIVTLAFANLLRLPARTLLGAAGLFVGAAALTVLVAIERSFGGTLVGTLLGNAISVQVRGSDFVAIGLTILLAAVSVADVLYLNLRERSAELATLRAVGWSDGQLRASVALEALGIGLIGSVAGATLGVVLGAALLGVGLLTLLVAAVIAGAGGVAVAIAASLVPLSQVGRVTPHAVLATE